MANEDFEIEDYLYTDKNESECIIEQTKTLLKDIDDELVDKVVRIKIKGQIDGN